MMDRIFKSRFAAIGPMLEIMIPVLSFFLIPIYYDSNWRWFLASNPEVVVIILTAMILLLTTGMIKATVYIKLIRKGYFNK